MSAQGLPAHILALFTPRPPLEYKRLVRKRKMPIYSGCADFGFFEEEDPPVRETWESPKDRKDRATADKKAAHELKIEGARAEYEPHKDDKATGDPFKTLFVARISYDTPERKLRKEFETWGRIAKIRAIQDLNGKPRGYAFVEFEHERDLRNAYKQADGKKIDGRRVLVDVERGRTVEGWHPRRLGGGRGPGRMKVSKKKQKEDKLAAATVIKSGGDDERKEREEKPAERREERRDEPARSGGVIKSQGPPEGERRDRDRRGSGGDRDRDRDRKEGGDRERRGDRDRDRDRDRKDKEGGRERRGDRDRDRDRARREEVKTEVKAEPGAEGEVVKAEEGGEKPKEDRDRDRDRRKRDRDEGEEDGEKKRKREDDDGGKDRDRDRDRRRKEEEPKEAAPPAAE